jgi:hypothetical protein
MAAAVSTSGAFSPSAPRMLFEGRYFAPTGSVLPGRTYDVSLDGKRFLMLKDIEANQPESAGPPLVAVLNFFDELKRLAPPKR